MTQVKELIQQQIGSAPILKALIQKMGFIPIIDRNLPLDPRRIGPTHGEAVAAMVVCLLQGVRALYRMEQFAAEEPALGLLFPPYDAKAWHDDHLGESVGRHLGVWPRRAAGGGDSLPAPGVWRPRGANPL